MDEEGIPEVDPRVEEAHNAMRVYDDQTVNRNIVDPQRIRERGHVDRSSARPDHKEPHTESPEYGRWVWSESGDGYGVDEIDAEDASWDDVMDAFGAIMSDPMEEDEPYRTDGGTMADISHGHGYDGVQASMERGRSYQGIPIGGMPSYNGSDAEYRSEDSEDTPFMGDFPM